MKGNTQSCTHYICCCLGNEVMMHFFDMWKRKIAERLNLFMLVWRDKKVQLNHNSLYIAM
jgi:hypothetical protein